MKIKIKILVMIILVLTTQSVVARLQKDARECIKPRFSKFTPPNLSAVMPGSKVTFVANRSTAKATLRVTAKGIKIKELNVIDKNSFYIVEFILPESLQNTFARLHIYAQAKVGLSSCQHKDGWLLKILGDESISELKETKFEPPK